MLPEGLAYSDDTALLQADCSQAALQAGFIQKLFFSFASLYLPPTMSSINVLICILKKLIFQFAGKYAHLAEDFAASL